MEKFMENSTFLFTYTSVHWYLNDKCGNEVDTTKIDHSLSLSAAYFLLAKLPNVKFNFKNPCEVLKAVKERESNMNMSEVDLFLEGVSLGIIHTIINKFTPLVSYLGKLRYSPSIFMDRIVILSCVDERPNSFATERLTIQGLSRESWMAVVASLVALASISTILLTNTPGRTKDKMKTFIFFVWFYSYSTLQISPKEAEKHVSKRVILLVWILGSTILVKSYSGNLRNELLSDRSSLINTIDDILATPNLIPLITENSPFELALKHSNDDGFKKLARRAGKGDQKYSEDDKMNLFSSGRGVSFASSNEAAYLAGYELTEKLQRQKKKIYIGTIAYTWTTNHLVLNNNVPQTITNSFDYLICRYYETSQWKTVTKNRHLRSLFLITDGKTTTSVHTLYFENVITIFKFWFYGILICTSVLLAEFLTALVMEVF